MTNRYVSNVASNGYVVGVDTNNGLSLTTPYLTLSKALSVSSAADIITVNGNMTASSSDPQGLNYFNMNFGATLQASVPGVFTLKAAAGQSQVLNILALSGSPVVDGFIIDDQGNTTFCINNSSSTTAPLMLKNLTVLHTSSGSTMVLDQSPAAKFSMLNCTINGVATAGGVNVTAANGNKIIDIDGVTGAVTGLTNAKSAAIIITATATGATANIRNCNGLTATSGNNGTCAVIQTVGFIPVIENNINIVINEAVTNTNSAPILVQSGASAFLCEGAVIRGNTGQNNCSGGYLLRVGTDGSSGALDNQVNYPTVYDNDFRGNPASSSMHGYMFGAMKGGTSFNNIARCVAISFLSKLQTEGAKFTNDKAYSPVSGNSICYSKGSVGAQFIGIEAHFDNGYTGFMYRFGIDPTIPTAATGGVARGGTVHSMDVGGVSQLVSVEATCDATFSRNNYNVVGVTGTPWAYQGTTYATFALWAAARELTSVNLVPTVINGRFHREVYRKLAASRLEQTDPGISFFIGLS